MVLVSAWGSLTNQPPYGTLSMDMKSTWSAPFTAPAAGTCREPGSLFCAEDAGAGPVQGEVGSTWRSEMDLPSMEPHPRLDGWGREV